MATQKEIDIKLFDVRAVDRNIDKGHLSAEDLQKHLDALPDAADKAAEMDVDQYDEIAEREERRRQREETEPKATGLKKTVEEDDADEKE